jgi:hypothetical protein
MEIADGQDHQRCVARYLIPLRSSSEYMNLAHQIFRGLKEDFNPSFNTNYKKSFPAH